ncbi:hypothetical protein CHU98_g10814 [Xylaria longipes]|nr:hypothetical protein CHU98_g10814 [Xylaria longipes]
MDEAPTAGAVEVVTTGATETDEVVAAAADVVVTAVLDSAMAGTELDDGIAAVEDVLESTAAELDEEAAGAADVLEFTATELENETAIALDVLGSTTVDKEVGNAFDRGTEDACEGTATTAIYETNEVVAAEDVPMTGMDEVAAIEVEASARPDEMTWAMEDAIDEPSAAGTGTPKAVPQAISCIIVVVIVVVANCVTVTCLFTTSAP